MEELNKFRKFLNEDKFKVGDIVTMTGGGSPMKITGNCSLGGMKMATYSVKKSDGKEVEYDESELTLAESILNESLEYVTKEMWDIMGEEERINALLTAIKDPDESQMYFDKTWDMLPDIVQNNMTIMPSEYFNPSY